MKTFYPVLTGGPLTGMCEIAVSSRSPLVLREQAGIDIDQGWSPWASNTCTLRSLLVLRFSSPVLSPTESEALGGARQPVFVHRYEDI